jgi:iron complex outermembrane receptor protein
MRRIILAVLFSLNIATSFAGGIIKGNVSDLNAYGLPGVSVVVQGTGQGTVTGLNGDYILNALPDGEVTLKFSCVGFVPQTRKVTVKDGATVVLNIILETAVITTGEVVVTGTRIEKTSTEVPGRIDVINAGTIRAIPMITVDDLMQAVPGVMVSRGYGIFSNKAIVTMRGLGGKEQSRVLVLVDGIPVNKTDGGSVNWNMINPASVERIEVAKGPASSLYGGNAMGGIIQVITKKPDKPITGEVSLRGGSFATLGGDLYLGGKVLTNKTKKDRYLYWNVNGFGNYSKGYYTEPNAELRAQDSTLTRAYLKEYNAGGRIGYVINARQSIESEVNYYDDWRGSGTKVVEPTGGFTRHATWQTRARYKAEIGKFKIAAHAFLQRENYHAMNESYKDYMYKLYDVSSVRSDFGLLLHVTQGLWKNNELTEGVDIKQGAVNAADVYYTSTDKVNNAGKMNFYAVYFQDEQKFLKDKLLLEIGLRFDYSQYFDGLFTIEDPSVTTSFLSPFVDDQIEGASWQAFSPKLCLQYRPVSSFKTYISAAQGFRPPILDDMCRSGKIRGGFKIANPQLKPETITSFEWGAGWNWKEKIELDVSAYYSLGKDFMYYVSTGDSVDLGYTPLTPVFIRKNISNVTIWGLEAAFRYQIIPNLSLYVNYAYTHSLVSKYQDNDTTAAADLTGKFLADVPMHSGSAGIRWTNPWVNLSAGARYVGSMYINDKNEFDNTYLFSDKYPAYVMLDCKIWRSFWKNHIELALDVQNITNHIVYDSKNQASAGRMIFGELSYKF